jgi:hypothetical protein
MFIMVAFEISQPGFQDLKEYTAVLEVVLDLARLLQFSLVLVLNKRLL